MAGPKNREAPASRDSAGRGVVTRERLQKILARAGVASRRAAEQLIAEGRVRVNGTVAAELGTRADPDGDRIEVDGRPIARESHVYYLVHKPRGMVTTLKDPEGRPSLTELLRGIPERVYPVGRLDFHTSGALLLTNDGDLAQSLLHPSRAVPKTYVAKLNAEADETFLQGLERGVVLDDGYRTQPARVEHIRDDEGKSWIQITITEGKNRQIHRMVEALGARVMRLSRLSFAGLSTEGLRPGDVRPLDRDELAALRRDYLGEEVSRAAPAKQRERRDEQAPRAAPSKRREARGEAVGRAASPSKGRVQRGEAVGRAASSTTRNARTQGEKSPARVDRARAPRHKNRPT